VQVFLKKLLGQESGYSGNRPNQRGKYFLIPRSTWDFFPDLSQGTRNSFCSIRVRTPNNAWIGILYFWHNTKYFPEVGGRAHDERRLYRNIAIDEELFLDRDVIVGFMKSENSPTDFFANTSLPNQLEYESLLKLLGENTSSIFELENIKHIVPNFCDELLNQISTSKSIIDVESVKNANDFFEEAKRRLEYLGPVVNVEGDPLLALSSTFKTQADFSNAVRNIYKGKCALRESYIYKDHPVGLEAAHIHAKTNGGNFLPSNGMLLSTDLHRAFDAGIWTLTNDYRVQIHEKITDGILLEFKDKLLAIPEDSIAFKPFLGYIKWHRENRFGLFTRETLTQKK